MRCAVLAGEGHEGAIYELGGDQAFTLAELAATVAEVSSKPVTYRDLPAEEFQKVLEGVGFPPPVASVFADVDTSIANGALFVDSGDLSRLIGRPTTPLRAAVEAALR